MQITTLGVWRALGFSSSLVCVESKGFERCNTPQLMVVIRAYDGPMLRSHPTVAISLACALLVSPAFATDTVAPGQLPDALQSMWRNYQPDLGELGRCAVAFDSHTDRDKMAFTCSVGIRITAEGERRSLARCEDMRQQKGIRSACRLVR